MSYQTQQPPPPQPGDPQQPGKSSVAKDVAKGIGVGLLKKLIGFAVVIAIAVAGYFFFFKGSDAASVNVGQCMSASGNTSMDVNVAIVDCKDPSAVYKVMAKGETCDEAEVTYTYQCGRGGSSKVSLCLGLNVEAGDCVIIEMSGADQLVPCAGAPANADKVLKVDTTTADDSVCPDGTESVLANATRKSVICLGPNK